MATKRIKFIKAYQMFPVGSEAELDTPIADLLIKNGRAKEAQAPAPKPAPKRTPKKPPRKDADNANH